MKCDYIKVGHKTVPKYCSNEAIYYCKRMDYITPGVFIADYFLRCTHHPTLSNSYDILPLDRYFIDSVMMS
jgi:hypothetical protein